MTASSAATGAGTADKIIVTPGALSYIGHHRILLDDGLRRSQELPKQE
jgi:hypothetical protein